MSLRSLIYDDRYFNDNRIWTDRNITDSRGPSLYGHSWKYWDHPYYNYRYMNPRVRDNTIKVNSTYVPTTTTTKLYYPTTFYETCLENMPLRRSNSFVSIRDIKDESDKVARNCDFKITEVSDNAVSKSLTSSSSSNMTKSMTNVSKCSSCYEPTTTTIEVKPLKTNPHYIYENYLDNYRYANLNRRNFFNDDFGLYGHSSFINPRYRNWYYY